MDEKYLKGGPMPNSIGAAADLYAEVRDLRLQMQKAAEAVQDRETELFNAILGVLNESADTGASGQKYRVQRVEKDRVHVTDWPAFHQWIREAGRFEMLQKRASDTAVMEWLGAAGAPPPGVTIAKVPTLSFTKV